MELQRQIERFTVSWGPDSDPDFHPLSSLDGPTRAWVLIGCMFLALMIAAWLGGSR